MKSSIAVLVKDVPRARIAGVLARLRAGEPFRIAILSEGLDGEDRLRFLKIAEEIEDLAAPPFIAMAIDALYEQSSALSPDPEVVWTGPRVDAGCDYMPTLVAARKIVGAALRRITIAGYQISASTMERLGVWSALDRGLIVEAIVNNKEVLESDHRIMVSKGVRVHRVTSTSSNFAKFHVKALTSDGASALIGSANFTPFGQTTNIEMGLYVVGPVAAHIEAMLYRYLETARSTGWVITA